MGPKRKPQKLCSRTGRSSQPKEALPGAIFFSNCFGTISKHHFLPPLAFSWPALGDQGYPKASKGYQLEPKSAQTGALNSVLWLTCSISGLLERPLASVGMIFVFKCLSTGSSLWSSRRPWHETETMLRRRREYHSQYHYHKLHTLTTSSTMIRRRSKKSIDR